MSQSPAELRLRGKPSQAAIVHPDSSFNASTW
jgi:hypothetical protein